MATVLSDTIFKANDYCFQVIQDGWLIPQGINKTCIRCVSTSNFLFSPLCRSIQSLMDAFVDTAHVPLMWMCSGLWSTFMELVCGTIDHYFCGPVPWTTSLAQCKGHFYGPTAVVDMRLFTRYEVYGVMNHISGPGPRWTTLVEQVYHNLKRAFISLRT